MAGDMVKFPSNGNQLDAYLSVPDTLDRSPAVVVLQEWWGLVPHIKDVADRFAAAGFVALAPDLYHGKTASEPDEANKLMLDMKRDAAVRDMDAAISYLKLHAMTSGRVGTIGFCLGGGLSLLAACGNPAVGACVDFYGVLPGGQPDCGRLQAPVLGIFGEDDQWIPREAIDTLERELRAMNRTIETVIYPNAGHAFFNDTEQSYDPEAAADAWSRTIEWFQRYLQ